MLNEPLEAPADSTPRSILAQYEHRLADIVSRFGVTEVVGATGLDEATVAAVPNQSGADLTLEAAASIAALAENAPPAEAILTEVRDVLLLEMSTAMLTVDRLATDLAIDLDPKEIQAKIEGRQPMTLDEYAQLRHYLASQQ